MQKLENPLEAVQRIYHMLEDKESQEIYMAQLNYLISGNSWHITNMAAKYAPSFAKESIFMTDFPNLVNSLPKERDFILYGAGEDAIDLLPVVARNSHFSGFCSRTKEKQKNGYFGFPVMSPETLLERKDLNVVISTNDAKDEILQILQDGGYPQEMIYDGPAAYRIVGKGREEQYFGPEFMTFGKDEVFVDAGCFDFGSSLALMKHCQHAKIYAFEPSLENYQRCLKRQKRNPILADAKLFPRGTWSERGILSFKEGGLVSCVCMEDDEDYSIAVMSIDEAIEPGDHVTMIKMDVEGAELESLKGAAQTIQRDKPKLAICIYHKPEDLWEIPLYIKELVPEYRLYIRHHSSVSSETVLYAVMPE